ncbi:hypothetical protein ACIBG8_09235 [Nonomuraea sp. NPDC050556]
MALGRGVTSTAAALITAAVFGGFALAVGVLVDAFVARLMPVGV